MTHENTKLARAFAAFSLPSQQASKSKELGFDPYNFAAPDGAGMDWCRSVLTLRSTSHLLIAPGADGLPYGSFATLRLIDLTERANRDGQFFSLPAASSILSQFKDSEAAAKSGEQIKAFNRALDLISDAVFCYMPSEPAGLDSRELDRVKIARGEFIRDWKASCHSGAPILDSDPQNGIFVFKMFSYRDGSECQLSAAAYQILTGGTVNGWSVGSYVPLRLSSVRHLSGNNSALNLYCYLNSRKRGIRDRLELSLYSLWTQIGGMHPAKSFYDSVKRSLPLIKEVWPDVGAFYNTGANADSETGRFQKAPKLVILQGRPQAIVSTAELEIDLRIAEHHDRIKMERQMSAAAKLGLPKWGKGKTKSEEVKRLSNVLRGRSVAFAETEKAMQRKQEQEALNASRLDQNFDPFDI
ncbi:MAG: hypothetical protein VR70_05155 [Rhodospirillaceae bacterium BRH_c57]|nr:MAG: hypothetical protein VR70_05155 [Rhodospirillaceae bacterium BRH_c57]